MFRSRVRRSVSVPGIATTKSQSPDSEYVKGIYTNISNDDMPAGHWLLATDTRESQIGKWRTRQGCDLLSIPIGEAVNVQQTSVTGAGTFSFSPTTWWAKKVTATSTGRLTAIEANLKNTANGTGTIVVALYSDSSGAPGTELVRTTIASNTVTSSAQYLKARSIACPDITNGTVYWVVGFVQAGGTNSYQVTTTTNASTGLTSTNSGTSWSAASLDFNIKLSTATGKPVKGCIRVRRSTGEKVTFLAHDSSLYTVNETTGATTAVDTGLDSAATFCRFEFVNDVLYSVQGTTKPRSYDFATAASVTTATANTADIIEHKGLLFYLSADDPTKMFYTNFGLYTTFTATDFIYVPSPKTSDPCKALVKLQGNLYIITRNSKYALFGSENSTFSLSTAVGQKGTFSRDSVAFDQEAVYLASDDGIYRFNGAEEKNIAHDVLDWWSALALKSNTVLELHNNRLYVFYTPAGQAQNSQCRVYNILYDVWESDDTGAYVGSTYTRYDNDNYFIQGSNRVGMLMLGETATNDYCNLGEPLTWELRTNYDHHGSPAAYKRVTSYRPHFDAVTGTYSVQMSYGKDYSDPATSTNLSLSATTVRFDTGVTFGSGAVFGGAQQVNPTGDEALIGGEWRRLQLRYKHYAAREPVSFDGHVLAIETQRVT